MPSLSIKTGGLKFVLGWLLVFLVRLIPFRPPNFEPMLAVVMPYGKRYDALSSFLFGFLGIVIFDAITSGIGSWTWLTAASYGLLGVGAYYYFRNRTADTKDFLIYGALGTLSFDLITGVLAGPILYGQSFADAFFGQIPFTISHLAGTIIFAIVLSPLMYRWIVKNDALELNLLPHFASQN